MYQAKEIQKNEVPMGRYVDDNRKIIEPASTKPTAVINKPSNNATTERPRSVNIDFLKKLIVKGNEFFKETGETQSLIDSAELEKMSDKALDDLVKKTIKGANKFM